MRGSVVWATVIGLLLGCIIGVAGMGTILLPTQFKLQQEQLKAEEAQTEFQRQQYDNELAVLHAQELQQKAEAKQRQLQKENAEWKLKYADAVRRVADLEQKQLIKKP